MVDGYYKFEIYRENTIRYKIRRLNKVGNHPLLNKIFENWDKLWVHKIKPLEIEGYIGYVVGSDVGIVSWLPIVFETSIYFPYSGILKAKGLKDVILFTRHDSKEAEVFEVFIYDGENELSTLMLQVMNDGEIDHELAAIKLKSEMDLINCWHSC